MEDTRHIHISDFDYNLPEERIAKYPKAERDTSKLLLYRNGAIAEDVFSHLPQYLAPGSLMVFNNTRVIQARLHFHKATGALIEVFCLEPHTPADYALSFAARGTCTWTCLVGNLKKWKEGALSRPIDVGGRRLTLTAERIGVSGTGHEVRFAWDDAQVSFAEVLEAVGELPIPPYLNRATEESDLRTYQTVYSKVDGSVAAPTAGLHFTPRVLAALDERGIERDEITLHVGAGTFRPVKSEEIAYFYSEEKNTYLVTNDGSRYVMDLSLDILSEELDAKRFFRISRNCIISMPAIASVVKYQGNRLKIVARPRPAFEPVVSRSRVDDFLRWLEGEA